MRGRYTLTATGQGKRARATLWADDDLDATMSAIATILGRAHRTPDGVWAKGAITLRDPAGQVLQEMPAKQ